MAYTPTVWETGDIIPAEKLNNIENGIVANEEAVTENEVKWIVAKQYIDMQTQQPTGDFTILSGSVDDLEHFPNVKIRVDLYIAGLDMHYSDMVFAPITHGYPRGGGTMETYTFFCLSLIRSNSTITSVPIWSLSYVPMNDDWIFAQGELAMHT